MEGRENVSSFEYGTNWFVAFACADSEQTTDGGEVHVCILE